MEIKETWSWNRTKMSVAVVYCHRPPLLACCFAPGPLQKSGRGEVACSCMSKSNFFLLIFVNVEYSRGQLSTTTFFGEGTLSRSSQNRECMSRQYWCVQFMLSLLICKHGFLRAFFLVTPYDELIRRDTFISEPPQGKLSVDTGEISMQGDVEVLKIDISFCVIFAFE